MTNNLTTLNLTSIKKGLLQGKKYGDKRDKDFRGFYYDLEAGLIKYNHCGSSAVKLESLAFVVNVIFDGLDNLEEKPCDYFIYA